MPKLLFLLAPSPPYWQPIWFTKPLKKEHYLWIRRSALVIIHTVWQGRSSAMLVWKPVPIQSKTCSLLCWLHPPIVLPLPWPKKSPEVSLPLWIWWRPNWPSGALAMPNWSMQLDWKIATLANNVIQAPVKMRKTNYLPRTWPSLPDASSLISLRFWTSLPNIILIFTGLLIPLPTRCCRKGPTAGLVWMV